MKGCYRLQTVPDSKEVEITAEFFVDPGGQIPSFLVNLITDDMSYFSTRKMMRFIKQEKYQNFDSPLLQRRPWVLEQQTALDFTTE